MRSTTAFLIATGLAANLVWALTTSWQSPSESPSPQAPNHAAVPELDQVSPLPSVPSHGAAHGADHPIAAPSAHLVAVPTDFAQPAAPAENPALERAFDVEPPDPERAARVAEAAKTALSGDAQLHVQDVRCTPTFCRLRMTKPMQSALAWQQVDQLLAPIAQGETIFTARPDGDANTTAHVYFAEPDAALPLDQVRPPGTRPGV